MSNTNRTVAHEFFYSDFESEYMPRYLSVGYRLNKFFSYNTVICAVVKDKKGESVTLLSSDNMTPTTTRHISHLWSASPFDIVYVPFKYGWNCWDKLEPEQLTPLFRENLEYLARQKMTLAKNRNEFIRGYSNALEFSERVLTLDFLDEYKELYETLTNDEKVKELKAKQRKLDAEKIAKMRAEFKKLLKENSFLQLVKRAYGHGYYYDDITKKLRKLLNPKNELSFIWRCENGDYMTSQHICMKKELGDIALKLWQNGKLKHGYKLGIYTVLSVTNKIVKIGCHNIPVENLKALITEQ